MKLVHKGPFLRACHKMSKSTAINFCRHSSQYTFIIRLQLVVVLLVRTCMKILFIFHNRATLNLGETIPVPNLCESCIQKSEPRTDRYLALRLV